jgi:hypothetical protein
VHTIQPQPISRWSIFPSPAYIWRTPELCVSRPIDLTHAAPAEQGQDFVSAEASVGTERHLGCRGAGIIRGARAEACRNVLTECARGRWRRSVRRMDVRRVQGGPPTSKRGMLRRNVT